MPYKNKKKYTKKRKTYRKRNATTMVSFQNPITDRTLVKLRYCTGTFFNPTLSGAVVSHIFRANDMFDPDFTATGHQPIGFDEYMAFYNHFTVLGSKIVAHCQSAGTTSADMSYVAGISLRDSSTVNTSLDNIRENGNVTYKMGSHQRDVVSLSKNFSAKKFFGTKNILGEDIYQGRNGASPTEQAFYHVWASALGNSGQDPAQINISVTVEYIAMLTERKQLIES